MSSEETSPAEALERESSEQPPNFLSYSECTWKDQLLPSSTQFLRRVLHDWGRQRRGKKADNVKGHWRKGFLVCFGMLVGSPPMELGSPPGSCTPGSPSGPWSPPCEPHVLSPHLHILCCQLLCTAQVRTREPAAVQETTNLSYSTIF